MVMAHLVCWCCFQNEKKLLDVVGALSGSGYWAELKSGLREHEVELYIPKFKTEYSKS